MVTTTGDQQVSSGVILGRVVDANIGGPAGGAVVVLATSGGQGGRPTRVGSVLADPDGRFLFRNLSAGSYTLMATLPGWAPGAFGRRRPNGPSRALDLATDQRLTDVTVTMWPPASISGTVFDDLGEPAVGIAVWALRRAVENGREVLTLTGGTVEATDDRGRYRLSGLMAGRYAVAIRSATRTVSVATLDAYQAAVVSGTARELMQGWSASGALRLTPGGIVVGSWQVQTSQGMPMPIPAADGRLHVHPTRFYPAADSPAQATIIALEAGEHRTGVDLTLPLVPGVRVSGVLMGPDGPVANSGMRLTTVETGGPEYYAGADIGTATTDQNGRFAFLGIPAGRYVVSAYRVPSTAHLPIGAGAPPPVPAPVARTVEEAPPASETFWAHLAVAVGAENIDDLGLVLQPGARLSGRVEFNGTAPRPSSDHLRRIEISLRRVSGNMRALNAGRPDPEGRFTTSGYPPGRYFVQVRTVPSPWTLESVMAGGLDALVRPITLDMQDLDNVVVTFTTQATEVSGLVRSRDPEDLPATVVAFPADYETWMKTGMSDWLTATATTDPSGTYRLRLNTAGAYILVAIPPDVAPEIDSDFVAAMAPSGGRLSIAAGERKTQTLDVSRVR
jgi:hypothetical protein